MEPNTIYKNQLMEEAMQRYVLKHAILGKRNHTPALYQVNQIRELIDIASWFVTPEMRGAVATDIAVM